MRNRLLLVLGAGALLGWFLYAGPAGRGGYQRTELDYRVPDVTLINQDGAPVPLRAFLNAGQPVLLEFVFTSCTTFCPEQSVMFTNFQKKIGESAGVRLVSISVDPEVDRPEVLKGYLQRYQARPGWDFLTGSKADIQQVLKAFSYIPADMATYRSSLLLRSARTGRWVRIDGRLDSKSMRAEYQRLLE